MLGQGFSGAPNRGEFGVYLGADSNSAFKVIQRHGAELFRVNRSGNVGIGTSTPGSQLEILNSSGGPGLGVYNASPGGRVASFGSNGAFQIDSSNSFGGRFAVLENGKVGIGNASPTFKLHLVDQSNTGLRVQTNTAGGTVASFGGNGAFQIDAPGIAGGRFTVLENGNVGVGAVSPQAQLHILSSSGNANLFIQGQGFNTGINFAVVSSGSPAELHISQYDGSYRDVIIIDNGGFVTLPRLQTGGNTSLCLNGFNQVSTCSSSLRYKTRIAPFRSGLSLIRQLRPISFDWKEGGIHDVGFGAEDVAKINPLFVSYNKGGQVEGVKYDRLSTVFVNAFNEQQTQIEQQQEQIKKQQTEIDALKKLVCANHPNAEVCKQ